jgi:hypothetical protein
MMASRTTSTQAAICLSKLRESVAFDLDFQCMRRCLASQFDRDADRTSGGDMVVLDQDSAIQAKAMIEINSVFPLSGAPLSFQIPPIELA